jgi:diketogulonate reductase-like aldo/keto reductase
VKARAFGLTGREVPIIGQGTWNIPTHGAAAEEAKRALRAGLDLGLVHIDTAEIYERGRSEELVGAAIRDVPRESLFIVSKVSPSNATYAGTLRACEASLRRIGTDYLDVYLLHWRGSHAVGDTMRALERLQTDGKIRALGVSNFDVDDLEEARAALGAHPLACNQVLYHLEQRGVENRLLDYCRAHGIAVVGYSPFGSGSFPSPRSKGGQALRSVAERHGATQRAVALAFLTRLEGTFTIPKASTVEHVRENASAFDVALDPQDVEVLSQAFPLPPRDEPLATI